jgi:hypothetical protein
VTVGLAFYALDVRNKGLVDAGSAALKLLEPSLGLTIITKEETRRWWSRLFSHTVIFRFVELLVAGIFAAGIVWAAVGYRGADHTRSPNIVQRTARATPRRP